MTRSLASKASLRRRSKALVAAAFLRSLKISDGDAYRAVYTVRFAGVVYVLHAFQKKSKKGIATPRRDIDLIKMRLKRAEDDYRAKYVKGTKP